VETVERFADGIGSPLDATLLPDEEYGLDNAGSTY